MNDTLLIKLLLNEPFIFTATNLGAETQSLMAKEYMLWAPLDLIVKFETAFAQYGDDPAKNRDRMVLQILRLSQESKVKGKMSLEEFVGLLVKLAAFSEEGRL